MVDEQIFKPDWVSPPGETISSILRERGVTTDDFASKLHKPKVEVEELLSGQMAITPDLAGMLATVLGASVTFWLAREHRYRNDLDRLHSVAAASSGVRWLSEVPLNEMVRLGWVRPGADQASTVASGLRFFGVPDVATWRSRYKAVLQATAFRSSATLESLPGAVAAWLRQGEILASEIPCETWRPDLFRTQLPNIRKLTREKDPVVFLPQLVQLCAGCGVAVVAIKTLASCKASGATKFLAPEKPLLMLSFRYLSDDHFWFTFFHEAAHLLLHSHSFLFLEGDDRISSKEEEEADKFAANILIPPEHEVEMLSLPVDGIKVSRFAKRVGVSPGIVVGQLQHRGVLRWNQMNNLKRRFQWVDEAE